MRIVTLYKIRDGQVLRASGHFSLAEQHEMARDGWRNLRKEHNEKRAKKAQLARRKKVVLQSTASKERSKITYPCASR